MRVGAAVVFAALVAAAPGLAEQQRGRDFSVAQAKRAFHAATGRRLVDYRAASTPDAASLRTQPYQTPRFGTFQLIVINPKKLGHMRRVFTHGVRPDRLGIYWGAGPGRRLDRGHRVRAKPGARVVPARWVTRCRCRVDEASPRDGAGSTARRAVAC
jgi:hypothetical protein